MSLRHLPRRLVLVDIENLAGTPSPSEHDVRRICCALRSALGDDLANTHVEVACSHHAAAVVRFGFPIGRHQWRSGESGADRALLDVLHYERVRSRFRHIVIASGDGIFADDVADLAAHGVRCAVIAGRGAVSARLRLAARDVCYLEGLDDADGAPSVA